MFPPLLLLPLLLLCHAAALLLWKRWVAGEVARNAADITANGSQDNLRAGYHQRRTWARVWPAVALVAAGSLAASLSNWWAFLTSCLALAVLLAAYFARFFTPALNLAMKLDYKPEYYASSDSASWPDAAIWKQVRASSQPGIYDRQPIANAALKQLLARVWLWGRLGYAAAVVAVAALLFLQK